MADKQIALVFPGQGSQVVGMGRVLTQAYPVARATFVQADEILDAPLSRMAWEGPENQLNDTINTQPALLIHSVAALRVLQELKPGIRTTLVAGHSMGELSALVAAGVLPFAEALKLARQRGKCMKEAGEQSPGGMAAILGLDIPTLDKLCGEASAANEIVQVANDNCPGQVVISGASAALERAIALAQRAGARRAVRLAVSIAAHSPLMTHAQAGFTEAVEAAPIAKPVIPIIGNVTAMPLVTVDQIRSDLEAQLTHRVRWTESIQYMTAHGVTTFLEIGSGAVLAGLIIRISKDAEVISLGSTADFEKLVAGIAV
jgi:[acyl-carrier-protein] S-malonyltransferase